MSILNPCKKCLVRPSCHLECKNFTTYEKITENITLGTGILIFYSVVISSIIMFFKILNISFSYLLLFYIVVDLSLIITFILDLTTGFESLNNLSPKEIRLLFILIPFYTALIPLAFFLYFFYDYFLTLCKNITHRFKN